LTLAAGAGAAPPTKIVFPVLGTTTYTDDFGDVRPGGTHQGIDIVAPKRSLALAAEAGKVEFWASSASAGCMLYLHGASKTTYYYIHLNNDLTARNDNKGKCMPGVAYAKGLRSGSKVAAGQPIGYVGDSGDANGAHAHLHFELHLRGKGAVDPYPWLQRGQHLLFWAPRGTPFTLQLGGTVASVLDDELLIRANTVGASPMRQRQSNLKRKLLVLVPETATVQTVTKPGVEGMPTSLASAKVGQRVVVVTSRAPTTLKAQRGDDLALRAALVSLVAP
jgi:hypothetical protein